MGHYPDGTCFSQSSSRRAAAELRAFGADWNNEADRLLKEAERIEAEDIP
jgi:hypothetical protein